jgi:8-oxo-dGTP pyrophosphatase MutT (NUDIX family)
MQDRLGGLDAHLARATRLRLPGDYVTLRLGEAAVGLVRPQVAALLAAWRDGAAITLPNDAALLDCQAVLVEAGAVALRGEMFDVRAHAAGQVLGQVDRGTLPVLGIEAQGVHVNGLVPTGDGWALWVARRSPRKKLDAGKLDHIVAGGICAGMDAASTLIKEADEEASVPAAVARRAQFRGTLTYAIERPEGLRRDRLQCYDLEIPESFTPTPRDGEVEAFSLMSLPDVLARVRDSDDFKFNVSLVLIDLFARLGLIDTPASLRAMRAG